MIVVYKVLLNVHLVNIITVAHFLNKALRAEQTFRIILFSKMIIWPVSLYKTNDLDHIFGARDWVHFESTKGLLWAAFKSAECVPLILLVVCALPAVPLPALTCVCREREREWKIRWRGEWKLGLWENRIGVGYCSVWRSVVIRVGLTNNLSPTTGKFLTREKSLSGLFFSFSFVGY